MNEIDNAYRMLEVRKVFNGQDWENKIYISLTNAFPSSKIIVHLIQKEYTLMTCMEMIYFESLYLKGLLTDFAWESPSPGILQLFA